MGIGRQKVGQLDVLGLVSGMGEETYRAAAKPFVHRRVRDEIVDLSVGFDLAFLLVGPNTCGLAFGLANQRHATCCKDRLASQRC